MATRTQNTPIPVFAAMPPQMPPNIRSGPRV